MESYFRYSYSVGDAVVQLKKGRLQKLKSQAARIITGGSFTTLALLLIESLGWKTIKEMISD